MGMFLNKLLKTLQVSTMLDSFDERESMYAAARKSLRDQSVTSDQCTQSGSSGNPIENRLEQLTFLKKLLMGAPQVVGYRRAWDIYNDIRNGGAEYVEKLYGPRFSAPEFSGLDEFRIVHRSAVNIIKREEEKAKVPKKRKATAENEGYSEPVIEPAVDNWRFSKENSIRSLIEDQWKADEYASLCARLADKLRISSDTAPIDSDSFTTVLKRATERYLRAEGRPILTNELADYSNPYMMRKAAMERLLHEGCVRNKLEETLVEQVIDNDPELTKLRSQADLPPEILEPLQAFRGITAWSFDPEIRMEQKLIKLNGLIDNILDTGTTAPPSSDTAKLSDGRVTHKFKNHMGFVSSVPRGRHGGWGHGKPESADKRDLARVRYPTLQRVAHSLPSDPHYRSQALHAIEVLERSRGWTYSDKTKAVNALKEVLDNLPSSRMIQGKLDKALPLVRYGRFASGTLSSSHKFVRRKPSNLARRNRIRMYFRSMTAITPLARRWADRRTKNQQRSKKKDSKR